MKFSRIIIKNVLILSVLVTIGCGYQNNAERPSIREIEKQISQSERLKNLDNICRNLAVFEDFEPERISIGRKNDILFYYYKLKANIGDVQNQLKQQLPKDGWILKREESGDLEYRVEFEKDNYWIQVSYHEFTELNYSTNCKDLAFSNK